jgi:hypothetical protein
MRVRDNRHRIMARLAHNNKIHWYVTPFIIKAEMAAKTRQRIREIVDAAFPKEIKAW